MMFCEYPMVIQSNIGYVEVVGLSAALKMGFDLLRPWGKDYRLKSAAVLTDNRRHI